MQNSPNNEASTVASTVASNLWKKRKRLNFDDFEVNNFNNNYNYNYNNNNNNNNNNNHNNHNNHYKFQKKIIKHEVAIGFAITAKI